MALTVGEFLSPLKKVNQREPLAAMYYLKRYEGRDAVTTAEIKGGFTRARHRSGKAIQFAAVLNQAAAYVQPTGKDGRQVLWSLTETGDNRVRELLGLPEAEPEVEHEVGSLQSLGNLTGVSASSVLFTDSYGNASGAAWTVGTGRLAVLMDVNWLEPPNGDMTTAPTIAQNLADFLKGS
jgi:hypothetical protein